MDERKILAGLMAGAAVYYMLDYYDCTFGKSIFIFIVVVLWILSVKDSQ